MPIKKYPNSVNLLKYEHVLSYFTHNKKAHFCSESKLFAIVRSAVSSVSPYPTVHLTTYPYIAVHIRHGGSSLLLDNERRFYKAVELALVNCLVND